MIRKGLRLLNTNRQQEDWPEQVISSQWACGRKPLLFKELEAEFDVEKSVFSTCLNGPGLE